MNPIHIMVVKTFIKTLDNTELNEYEKAVTAILIKEKAERVVK